MSWLSSAIQHAFGEDAWDLMNAQAPGTTRRKKKAARLLAAERAMGPTPNAEGNLDLGVGSGQETPEQRRRRLRRLVGVLDEGKDPYGSLTLGATGLLAG